MKTTSGAPTKSMGRRPCCPKEGMNRGAWTAEEDRILVEYIKANGEGKWRSIPKQAGLRRCGKSCRLRWLNYLRPDIKRGNISGHEEDLIIRLHKLLGNRWSLIAGRLPGRTDNEIKNYWNTTLSKRAKPRSNPSQIREKSKKPSSPDKPLNRPTPIRVKAARVFHAPTLAATESESSDGSFSNRTGLLSPNGELTSSDLLLRFDSGEMSLSDILASDYTKLNDFGVSVDGDYGGGLLTAEESDQLGSLELAAFLDSDEWIM